MPVHCHLAALSFTATPWLWLLALAGLPFLIHLAGNRPRRTIVIPTARFFHMSRTGASRRSRVRHWLLMVIRSATVAAIILAFARPVWNTNAPRVQPARNAVGIRDTSGTFVHLPDSNSPQHIVIIIDVSASMQRTTDGRSLFSEAVHEARRVLATLQPGSDQAAVILAGLAPAPLLPLLTSDIQELSRRLDAAAPTWEHADFRRATRFAARLLGRALAADPHSTRNEILILTDMQAGQWPAARTTTGPAPAWFSGVTFPMIVTLHCVAPEAPSVNTAVTGFTVDPPVPVAGVPSTLSATITNYSQDEPVTVTVHMQTDGQDIAQRMCTLAPGETRYVSCAYVYPTPGFHTAAASFMSDHADALAIDNKLVAGVYVRTACRVGIIADAPDSSASRYLALALQPDDQSPFVTTYLGSQVPSPGVSDMDALVICDETGLTRADLERLTEWSTATGIGAVLFVDTDATADLLAATTGTAEPLHHLPLTVITAQSEVATASGTPSHDSLASFLNSSGDTGIPVSEVLQTVLNRDSYQPVFQATTGASVHLFRADSRPVLASLSVGRGRIAMWAGSIRPKDSGVTRNPLFPALMQELILSVARTQAPPPVCMAGSDGVIPMTDRRRTVSVADLEISPENIPFVLVGSDQNREARLAAIPAPGLVTLRSRSTGDILGSATVRLDPLESDFAQAAVDDALTAVTGAAATTFSPDEVQSSNRHTARAVLMPAAGHNEAESKRYVDQIVRTVQLWPVAILCAVFLFATQAACAPQRERGR